MSTATNLAGGISVFANDVSNPEGPVLGPDGSWTVTEMGRGRITRFADSGRVRATVVETPRPNGLAMDGGGGLWIAESVDRALLLLTPTGSMETISIGAPGIDFLWPNDLCFGADRWIYLTDSGVNVGDFERDRFSTPIDGRLFRVDPTTGQTELLDRGLSFANGIAFGPDGDLYVAETLSGDILRYPVEGHRLGARSRFGSVAQPSHDQQDQITGPDGIAFDALGRLLVAVLGRGDITVLDGSGAVSQTIILPGAFPTNLAFSLSGSQALLVTEGSQNRLLHVSWAVDGLPLHQPQMR